VPALAGALARDARLADETRVRAGDLDLAIVFLNEVRALW
jgi:hypothetical protein